MGKYFEIADAELKDAARSGRAFLQWEALRQIALNLARIADSLEQQDVVVEHPMFQFFEPKED